MSADKRTGRGGMHIGPAPKWVATRLIMSGPDDMDPDGDHREIFNFRHADASQVS
jgi:hypothetical protein